MTKIKVTIRNAAKKTLLANEAEVCSTVLSKSIGLMFSRNPEKTLILSFKKNQIISLHMFFVFYPIDVLFLDKNKIVVDIKENFIPFTFYASKAKAAYAVELPKKSVSKSRTVIGDKIKFR